ncbi:MAG: DUF4402 domain-containing protein [Pacificimonas sp.]|jgi:hypothetical protein|nr:DUF4402 domain-containing protein [Pacificimonas sp.]
MFRRVSLSLFLALFISTAGRAQSELSVAPLASPSSDIGTLVGGSGVTRYRIDRTSGSISLVSGDGVRLSSGGVNRALVTITCNGTTFCDTSNVQVEVGVDRSNTGRFQQAARFRIDRQSGSITGGQSGGQPRLFQFATLGDGGSASFFVSHDIRTRPASSGRPFGASTMNWGVTVYHVDDPGNPLTVSTFARGDVLRPIGISQGSVLDFGTLAVGASASGTVTINAASGVRSISGPGVTGLAGSPGGRGVATVSGEGGQMISLSLSSSSINLTNGTDNLTANINLDTPTSTSLSGSLGNAGSVTYGIGGSVNIAGPISGGSYSGTVTATVQYN